MYDDTHIPDKDELTEDKDELTEDKGESTDGEGELTDIDEKWRLRFIEANPWAVEETEWDPEEEDGYFAYELVSGAGENEPTDPDDALLPDDGFFSFDGDDETREPGEAGSNETEDAKLEVLDLFLRSLIDDSVLDDASYPQLKCISELCRAIEKEAKAGNCPKGLYGKAVLAGKLYDELFAAA